MNYSQKKILLVEDDALNQEIGCKLLELSGIENIDIANNGLEALNMVKKNTYDLILMDINMPIMDGEEATKSIRALDIIYTPIVALSASMFQSDKVRYLQNGMDDALQKPLMDDALDQLLDKFLGEDNEKFTYDTQKTANSLGLDEKFIQKLLKSFQKNLDDELVNLKNLIEAEDYKAVRELAHKLKGRTGNLQITPMHKIFSQMEEDAKNLNMANGLSCIEKLSQYNKNL